MARPASLHDQPTPRTAINTMRGSCAAAVASPWCGCQQALRPTREAWRLAFNRPLPTADIETDPSPVATHRQVQHFIATCFWIALGCTIVAALSACGGGASGETVSTPASLKTIASGTPSGETIDSHRIAQRATSLASSTSVTPDALLDWAEYKYPGLFLGRSQTLPSVDYGGNTFYARIYSSAGGPRYLGVTTEGRVYGLGDFTGNALQGFGSISDWQSQVIADQCKVYPATCAPAAAVTVNASRTIVGLKETSSLTAIATDAAGAQLANPSVSWSSSNPSVASVSQTGAVKPLSQGSVTITATVGAAKGRVDLEVVFAVTDVDFSRPTRVTLKQGLLHGFNGQKKPTPPSSMITPLGIKYWRSLPPIVQPSVAAGLGASYDLVLSDLWGYPVSHLPNGEAFVNLSAFQSIMSNAAASFKSSVTYWEIWNEPDQTYGANYWDGTEAQFFATYLAAYRTLRSVLGPTALVVGPSITNYDEAFLDRFAAFCILNGCEANMLSWHEGGGTWPTQGIVAKVARAMARYGPASPNSALGVKAIHINEYGSPTQAYSPVASLLYLQYFEEAAVESAARACWTDSSGVSECFNNSLDGLLSPSDFSPRGVWYAYQLYAKGTDGRVSSHGSVPQLLSLASTLPGTSSSSPPAPAAQVLTGLGDIRQIANLPTTVRLGVRMTGISAVSSLTGSSSVTGTLYSVAGTGEARSQPPEQRSTKLLPVLSGTTGVVIEDALPEAVYQLVLSP